MKLQWDELGGSNSDSTSLHYETGKWAGELGRRAERNCCGEDQRLRVEGILELEKVAVTVQSASHPPQINPCMNFWISLRMLLCSLKIPEGRVVGGLGERSVGLKETHEINNKVW